MKYIITSGPMETEIDRVRKIQNSSTGKLGQVIAEQIIANGCEQLVYIHTKNALRPAGICKEILITNHQQLLTALQTEISDDCVVIHCMAVSDFETAGSITKPELAKLILNNKDKLDNYEDICKLIDDSLQVSDKLSSKADQIVFLNRSIKIIDEIKKINPKVKLIGFKLLSGVSPQELITVANATKERANCDYIVANIMEQVSADAHRAYIIGNDQITEVETKQQIAEKLIELMEE